MLSRLYFQGFTSRKDAKNNKDQFVDKTDSMDKTLLHIFAFLGGMMAHNAQPLTPNALLFVFQRNTGGRTGR